MKPNISHQVPLLDPTRSRWLCQPARRERSVRARVGSWASPRPVTKGRSKGFTIIELLIVVTLIGILVALLLPAVQAAREAARRSSCNSNLGQLILAMHQYEMSHAVYPSGTVESRGPILNWPRGYHHSWVVRILPHLEQQKTLAHVDFKFGVYDPQNAPVRRITLRNLLCPSGSSQALAGRCEYAGVYHDREAPIDRDNNGVFFLNSRVRHEHVTDGLSQTIFLGEAIEGESNMGWMSGTRATLRNTSWGPGTAITPPFFPPGPDGLPVLTEKRVLELERGAAAEEIGGGSGQAASNPGGKKINPKLLYVGGFGGPHPGGTIYAFGDGSVQFLSVNVDSPTYRRLGNRRDGRFLDEGTYR